MRLVVLCLLVAGCSSPNLVQSEPTEPAAAVFEGIDGASWCSGVRTEGFVEPELLAGVLPAGYELGVEVMYMLPFSAPVPMAQIVMDSFSCQDFTAGNETLSAASFVVISAVLDQANGSDAPFYQRDTYVLHTFTNNATLQSWFNASNMPADLAVIQSAGVSAWVYQDGIVSAAHSLHAQANFGGAGTDADRWHTDGHWNQMGENLWMNSPPQVGMMAIYVGPVADATAPVHNGQASSFYGRPTWETA